MPLIDFGFSTNDFTIEAWICPGVASSFFENPIFDFRGIATDILPTISNGVLKYNVGMYSNKSNIIDTTYQVAVSRFVGGTRLYPTVIHR